MEPNITSHKVFKLTDYQKAVDKADIIAFLVAHKQFKELTIERGKQVLDFCGIMNN